MDNSRNTMLIAACIVTPLALLLGLVVLIGAVQEEIDNNCAPPTTDVLAGPAVNVNPKSVPAGPIAGYGHEQLVNAAYVMLAAKELGLSVRDQQIGVMTAMGESSLKVLTYGDSAGPDSRGLFQQRDNGAWGTLADRLDPFISATNFFKALIEVDGRETLAPTIVAHRVQGNADPYHYIPYWKPAGQVVRALAGIDSTGPGTVTVGDETNSVGKVTLAVDNIYYKRPMGVFSAAVRQLAQRRPDFMVLNESSSRRPAAVAKATNDAYHSYRGGAPAQEPGGGIHSLDNHVAWRTDTWRPIAKGRERLIGVTNNPLYGGKNVRSARYATWVVLQNKITGSTVPVISTHMMTNVYRGPGKSAVRQRQYAQSMDNLIALTRQLAPYGSALVGGDMNSHPGDGPHAAAKRMKEAGYSYLNSIVMYAFYPTGSAVTSSQILPKSQLHDHGAPIVTVALDGTSTGTPPLGECPPCPTKTSLFDVGTKAAKDYHLGDVNPAITRLVNILAPKFGIQTVLGWRASATDPNGHPSGNAADFMVPSDNTAWATPQGKQMGDQLAAYAQAHARELNIDYIIWWQRIWSVERANEGWRPMEDRGSNNENHRNHVHINTVPGAPGTGAVPVDDAADGACATNAVYTDGPVTYPVPANLIDTDQNNWHDSGSNWSQWHSGTDFSAPCGTPVYAAHAGTVVVETGPDWYGTWLVKVTTGATSLTTWYAHMQALDVRPGQAVQPGQKLGEIGARGNSTGCHLHFEVHLENGSIYGPDNTDPSTWLAENVRRDQAA